MKSVGIICEYNPFHNGHLYHLQKVKELFPNHVIILILNTTFLQRGETSLFNKWTNTEIALNHGIDLVVELPYFFGSQSADLFAKGSIQLLHHLKVDAVVFGSESNDVSLLKNIANTTLTDEFNNITKKFLNKGLSYPKAQAKALKRIINKDIEHPNDILGISYIKQIKLLNSSIKPITIKRTNDFHSLSLNSQIISASGIRHALKNNLNVKNYLPNITYSNLDDNLHYIDNYFPFLKYKIISELNNLNIYHTVDEGIENRIKKYIFDSNSLEELIFKVKTKRYTYNKISRMLTHILCDFTKDDAKKFNDVEYIRILGFNKNGRIYLNKIKKELTIPLITNFSNIKNEMLDLEFKITAIYGSILNESDKNDLIKQEYKNKPIIM